MLDTTAQIELAACQQALWARPLRRPHVTVAFAQSLDGALTAKAGGPTPLSGAASLRWTHGLRAMHDGLLVGIGTVLADNPRLTVRAVEGTNPLRVVLDSRQRTPPSSHVLNDDAPTLLFCSADQAARSDAVIPIERDAGGLSLEAVLETLHRRGVRRLMVEGGARVLGSFVEQGLVDSLVITITPHFAGGTQAVRYGSWLPEGVRRLRVRASRRLEDDVVLIGTLPTRR